MAEQAYDKNRGPREMYQEHCQTVYRVAFTYMKNSYDAEDAVQETFARLIRSGERFRSREKEFLGYMNPVFRGSANSRYRTFGEIKKTMEEL